MYRHTILAILIALMLVPSIALAQETEPVGTVSTGDDEVARAYDNPNAYFEVTIAVMTLGTIYDSPEQASSSARSIANIFAAALTSDTGEDFEFGDLEQLTEPDLGDEAFASRVPFTLFGSFEGEYIILATRQENWVQVMIGFGVGNVDVLADLESISSTTLPRWPSEDPIALREDGLRTGGIWDMTPRPEDMPEGYVLDEGFEEGPGATVSAVVPVGTPGPAATEPAATPEPDVTEVTTPEPTATEAAATPDPVETVESTPEPTATEAAETPEPTVTEAVETPEPTATEPAATPEIEVTEAPATPAADATPEIEVTEAVETPEPTATEIDATEEPRDVPRLPATDSDATATVEPVDEQTATAEAPSGIATPDAINPRIALPFDVKIEVIFPLDRAIINEDGSCSGSGLLDGLTGDATLTLRTGQDGSLIADAPVSGPGLVAYDTVDWQEVCYFTASFTDVPPRGQYTLLAGESVLGRLTYEELHTGQSVLVVLGGE